jgi:hypothetical protein
VPTCRPVDLQWSVFLPCSSSSRPHGRSRRAHHLGHRRGLPHSSQRHRAGGLRRGRPRRDPPGRLAHELGEPAQGAHGAEATGRRRPGPAHAWCERGPAPRPARPQAARLHRARRGERGGARRDADRRCCRCRDRGRSGLCRRPELLHRRSPSTPTSRWLRPSAMRAARQRRWLPRPDWRWGGRSASARARSCPRRSASSTRCRWRGWRGAAPHRSSTDRAWPHPGLRHRLRGVRDPVALSEVCSFGLWPPWRPGDRAAGGGWRSAQSRPGRPLRGRSVSRLATVTRYFLVDRRRVAARDRHASRRPRRGSLGPSPATPRDAVDRRSPGYEAARPFEVRSGVDKGCVSAVGSAQVDRYRRPRIGGGPHGEV